MYIKRLDIITFFIFSLLSISCNDKTDESFGWDTGSTTSVTMIAPDFPISPSARTILTPDNNGTSFSWKKGDIVAVYSDSKGMTNFYIDDESISNDGTSADFNGSGFKLLEKKPYYAFYPYNLSQEYLDKTKIPVTYSNQYVKSNGDCSSLGEFDYMYAKGVTDNNAMVAFTFQHLGCVVEFKLTVPKTANYTSLRLEQVGNNKALYTTGNVNLSDQNPHITINESAPSDSIINVTLNETGGGIKVSKDSLLSVYMMMPPCNLSESTLKIRLVDDNQNWYAATVDGKNMHAGYTYRYEVNNKTGGFTGSGTGLPNDGSSVELVSTYTHTTNSAYEGMILDGNILYTAGLFGVRSINYNNENSPSLINSQLLSRISNNRSDMRARSITQKDNYLYVAIRQSSSGNNENKIPALRFKFEYYPENNTIPTTNGISSNTTVNSFFKTLHVNSINLNQNIKIMYLYKGHVQNGYYLNTINIQGEDGTSTVLFRETYNTKEEAMSALKAEYRNDKGDYCTVDWSALPNNFNVFQNVRFYKIGEFDSYQHTGTTTISKSSTACPNTGEYSICMDSGSGSSQNAGILTSNISSKKTKGFLSFWCKVDKIGTSDIEIPLLGLSGKNVMSFVLHSSGNESYTIGVKSNGIKAFSSVKIAKSEWYNYKIEVSSSHIKLWYRTKEAGDWVTATTLTLTQAISFNQLTTGINSNNSNDRIYFDDYYYNETDIDAVSYINGKLAILNKNTLDVIRIYNLDVKAIDVKVFENRLVVTCFYGFNVYDISDPSNPQLTYSYRVNEFKESQNCEIYEANGRVFAFICNYTQGYTIADITDVNNVSIACLNDYKDITYNGENLYGKIYNFDVSIDYPYAYLTNAVMRNYLNTYGERRGILTIDLTDFNNPKPQFSFVPSSLMTTVTNGDPRPTHIARSGNNLIINNTEKGLLFFNIDANGIPTFSTKVSVPGKPSINDIYVPYDGCIFVNDNDHGGSTWTNRNVYLYRVH